MSGFLLDTNVSSEFPLNTPDGMIATTALKYGLTLATRNARDFEYLGVAIINPWESA